MIIKSENVLLQQVKPGYWATWWSQFGETGAPSVRFALKMHARFLPRWPFKCPWIHLSEIRLLSPNALKKRSDGLFGLMNTEWRGVRSQLTRRAYRTSSYNEPDRVQKRRLIIFLQHLAFLSVRPFRGKFVGDLISYVNNFLSWLWIKQKKLILEQLKDFLCKFILQTGKYWHHLNNPGTKTDVMARRCTPPSPPAGVCFTHFLLWHFGWVSHCLASHILNSDVE